MLILHLIYVKLASIYTSNKHQMSVIGQKNLCKSMLTRISSVLIIFILITM